MAEKQHCCRDMEKAHQRGTDNEMYGPLAYEIDGGVHMGCDLPPIGFCPWCGTKTSANGSEE